MRILDSLEAAGVAWCSEADFARLIAVARAASTFPEETSLDELIAAIAPLLTTEGSDERIADARKIARAALEPRAEA